MPWCVYISDKDLVKDFGSIVDAVFDKDHPWLYECFIHICDQFDIMDPQVRSYGGCVSKVHPMKCILVSSGE